MTGPFIVVNIQLKQEIKFCTSSKMSEISVTPLLSFLVVKI